MPGSTSAQGRATARAALLLWVAACTTDHSNLTKRSDEEPDTQRPEFDFSGDAGARAMPGSDDTSSDPEPVDPRANLPPEPRGNPALTLLHGVVDARTVYFCLITSAADGDAERVIEQPLPEGGLQFGESVSLAPEDGLDFDGALQVYLVAAEPSLVEALSCSTLLGDEGVEVLPSQSPERFDAGAAVVDAGPASDAATARPAADAAVVVWPPAMRVRALAELAPGTLAGEFSFLLTASGCIGAPGFEDDSEEIICGPSYSSRRTSLTPIFVQLSRRGEFDSVGLQVVNANQALRSLTVRSNPADGDGTLFSIASEVVVGQIAPRRARTGVAVERLGNPLDAVRLEILARLGGEPIFAFTWGSALQTGKVERLEDGRTYSLVLIGPVPGIPETRWWNAPTLTLVENDPFG